MTCPDELLGASAERIGLGYDEVAGLRPDIVYVALPGFGSTEGTPYHDYLAWGPSHRRRPS